MNYDRWKHLLDGNDLEPMDWRHVQMIHAVLELEKPRHVTNIGIANGFSSAATIEAAEAGFIQLGEFIDIKVRDSFKNMLCKNHINKLAWFEQKSDEYDCLANCWIIDGDHKEGAIKDYENALKGRAKIIIAHDTSEDWAPDIQFGAIEIGKRMRKDSVMYFEDRAKRDKEKTHRGLVIAFYYQPKPETIERLKELAL